MKRDFLSELARPTCGLICEAKVSLTGGCLVRGGCLVSGESEKIGKTFRSSSPLKFQLARPVEIRAPSSPLLFSSQYSGMERPLQSPITAPKYTVEWFRSILGRSTDTFSFPLVWTFQKIFGLSAVSWLSLSGPQVAAEIEERKFRARHLHKLHHIFGRLVFIGIMLEILRQPVLWFLINFVDLQSIFFTYEYVSSKTLFYVIYGFVIAIVCLVLVEIFRYSYTAPLQVPLGTLQAFHAESLANTSMFTVARGQEEDPRDKFARNLRLRHSVKQEADQMAELSFSQYGPNDSGYLRVQHPDSSPFQRQHSGGFARSSPRRNFNDSMNKSFNRSFGSSHSSGSKSSSPSCLYAAVDWDPVDRDEIENFCGHTALNKLMAQEQLFEKQRLTMLEDESMNWSPQIQSLREQNYQTSTSFHIPSPKKSKKPGTPDLDESMERLARLKGDDKVYPLEDFSWMQLKVSVETLHFWTANLRMWIADTVISPLLLRIDQVNLKLHEKMHMENVLGESAPDQLRMIAQQCRQDIPELLQVIPFLDISMQQDYVVRRLRELVKDGVLGDYSWNSGSSYGGQPWQDFLPTDAALVMHCFITFLDVVLPPDPHAPNWRSFSHRYVLRSLGAWKTEDPNKPVLHQAVSNPPKYEILYGNQLLQVAEGKNNVFHTILLFARLMQLREKNGQGYANLGPGRIIFRVFDTSTGKG